MEEFYKGFAQRARDLADKADPFTRRRLLDLAKRYDLKSRPGSEGGPSMPVPRGTQRPELSSSGEAERATH